MMVTVIIVLHLKHGLVSLSFIISFQAVWHGVATLSVQSSLGWHRLQDIYQS